MGRGSSALAGGGLLLLGFLVGRAVGPAPVSFPDPGKTLDSLEMERSVRSALSEPRAFPRAGRLIRLFEGLSPENIAGASRSVSERAGRTDPVDLQIFLSAWVHLDGPAAIREVQTWPVQSRREIGTKTVMREWAASGRRVEAANYFETITDPDRRAMMAGPLVRGWALAGDFDGALRLARRIWESDGNLSVADGFVRGVLNTQGPKKTIGIVRAAETDPGGEFDHRLVRVTLNLVGREDPVAAADYYGKLIGEGPRPWLEGSLARLAGSWRNTDPQAALEWLIPLPEGPERTRALMETMGTWAIRDLDVAWTWFRVNRALGEADERLGPTDSALLAGLLRRMARVRPAEASRWVTRLGEESKRETLLMRVAHFWSIVDPVSASDWIASLDLEPALRARVREASERGKRAREG